MGSTVVERPDHHCGEDLVQDVYDSVAFECSRKRAHTHTRTRKSHKSTKIMFESKIDLNFSFFLGKMDIHNNVCFPDNYVDEHRVTL